MEDWYQDDIIGYEGNTDASNPNYTRSIGYAIEPTTLLGLIGTYQINSMITVQAGIAENYTTGPIAVGATPSSEEVSSKVFAGAVAFTAPDSWGFLKGATANAGVLISPFKGGADNYYAGVTLPTPISALKVGASFDLRSVANQAPGNSKNDSGFELLSMATFRQLINCPSTSVVNILTWKGLSIRTLTEISRPAIMAMVRAKNSLPPFNITSGRT